MPNPFCVSNENMFGFGEDLAHKRSFRGQKVHKSFDGNFYIAARKEGEK